MYQTIAQRYVGLSGDFLLIHWMKQSNIDCQIVVIENSFLVDLNHAPEINHATIHNLTSSGPEHGWE